MASETSRISMPRPSPWTWSMRSALLDCSTISAMRAWSITSAPAKPWTSGRLTTSRRAASESASWKLTRSPPVDAPTANMQRLATSAIVGGRRRESLTPNPLLVRRRALDRAERLAQAPVEEKGERPGERGPELLAVLEILVGDEDGRRREVDVRVLSELELEPPEHSAASALAEASDLGVAHKYPRQEGRRQLGPLVGAEQRAEGLVDQGQLEIAGERRVVVDLHDQAVAGRGVADAGEVRLLGRNLSTSDRELRRGGRRPEGHREPDPRDEPWPRPPGPLVHHTDLLQRAPIFLHRSGPVNGRGASGRGAPDHRVDDRRAGRAQSGPLWPARRQRAARRRGGREGDA